MAYEYEVLRFLKLMIGISTNYFLVFYLLKLKKISAVLITVYFTWGTE